MDAATTQALDAQIAGRADIAGILQSPTARGRAYISHATDEPGTSSAIPTAQQLDPAPNHITAVRTRHGQLGEQPGQRSIERNPMARPGLMSELYASVDVRRELNLCWPPISPERLLRDLYANPQRLADKGLAPAPGSPERTAQRPWPAGRCSSRPSRSRSG